MEILGTPPRTSFLGPYEDMVLLGTTFSLLASNASTGWRLGRAPPEALALLELVTRPMYPSPASCESSSLFVGILESYDYTPLQTIKPPTRRFHPYAITLRDSLEEVHLHGVLLPAPLWPQFPQPGPADFPQLRRLVFRPMYEVQFIFAFFVPVTHNTALLGQSSSLLRFLVHVHISL